MSDPIDRPLNDSGARTKAETGYLKEPDGDRRDFSWVLELEGFELVPREMIERMAAHMVKGAQKYVPENWRLGTSPSSLTQFRRSLSRHVFQWFHNENDEDHAAAITFNLWAHEINTAPASVIPTPPTPTPTPGHRLPDLPPMPEGNDSALASIDQGRAI